MISFYVFENDPFVRTDVIDILNGSFSDVSLTISDTLAQLSKDVLLHHERAVALVSGTTQEIIDFFASKLPANDIAYVVCCDSQASAFPYGYSVSVVPKPFTNESLIEGVNSALSFLPSSHSRMPQ